MTCARMPSTRSGWVVREPQHEPVLLRERGAQVGQLARAAHGLERHGERGGRQLAEQVGGGGCLGLGPRAQPLDDLGDGVGGEGVVDPGARASSSRDGSGVSSNSSTSSVGLDGIRAGLERVAQPFEPVGRHEVVGEAGVDRIGGVHRPRPVSPRYSPRRPGACASSQVPPTSGVKPMRVSGIASFERSVTMRIAACPARPMPPPIVMPSAIATMGFGYSAMRALSAYSARKNTPVSSASPAADLLGEAADVASGAQAAIAGAVEQHDVDVGVVLPRVERRREVADHAEVERVDRARTVEGEVPESAVRADEDAGLGDVGHARNVTARLSRADVRSASPRRRDVIPAQRAQFPQRYGERLTTTRGFGMPDGQVLEFSGVTKRFGAITAVSDFSARVESGRRDRLPRTRTAPARPRRCASCSVSCAPPRAPRRSAARPTPSSSGRCRPSAPCSRHPASTPAAPRRTTSRSTRRPPASRDPRVDDVLGLVGLADAAGRKVGGFSLGMRQRLGLAYALLGDPGVLVLDEPANGLDPEGIKWMRGFLRQLAREGRTVLDVVAPARRGAADRRLAARHLAGPARLPGRRSTSSPTRRSTRPSSTPPTAPRSPTALTRRRRHVRGAALRAHRARSRARARSARSPQPRASRCRRCSARGPALEEVFLDLVNGTRVHPSAAARGSAQAEPAALGASVERRCRGRRRQWPRGSARRAGCRAEAPRIVAQPDAGDAGAAAACRCRRQTPPRVGRPDRAAAADQPTSAARLRRSEHRRHRRRRPDRRGCDVARRAGARRPRRPRPTSRR